MGVFSAIEDYSIEELHKLVLHTHTVSKCEAAERYPAYSDGELELEALYIGYAAFVDKLDLYNKYTAWVPRALVPKPLLERMAAFGAKPNFNWPPAIAAPAPRPRRKRVQQQDPELQRPRPVNLGRIWFGDPIAPAPQAEAAPAEELGNAIFNHNEMYQDPF